MNKQAKKIRTFSQAFQKEKVKMLEQGDITPTELCKLYGMASSTIYRWKKKHGSLPANERVVLEKDSDRYRSSHLLKHIKELEAMVGRTQMELSYFRAVIQQANQVYGTDIEKKFKKK